MATKLPVAVVALVVGSPPLRSPKTGLAQPSPAVPGAGTAAIIATAAATWSAQYRARHSTRSGNAAITATAAATWGTQYGTRHGTGPGNAPKRFHDRTTGRLGLCARTAERLGLCAGSGNAATRLGTRPTRRVRFCSRSVAVEIEKGRFLICP